MNQKELAQLVKLLGKWAAFVKSGRHELPDAESDAVALQASEPMLAELAICMVRQIQRWLV